MPPQPGSKSGSYAGTLTFANCGSATPRGRSLPDLLETRNTHGLESKVAGNSKAKLTCPCLVTAKSLRVFPQVVTVPSDEPARAPRKRMAKGPEPATTTFGMILRILGADGLGVATLDRCCAKQLLTAPSNRMHSNKET